jgi:hypothetical protein
MIKSDGGSTAYYDLPKDAKDIGDLIEYRDMSFNIGNVFKACYRLGEKEGVDDIYDLQKIIYFANRELKRAQSSKRERPPKAETAEQSAGGSPEPQKWIPTDEFIREETRRRNRT